MGHAHHARKHYSQEQALEWIIQIAKGLRYLHTSKPKVHALTALQEFLLTLSSGSCPCSGTCTEIMHHMGYGVIRPRPPQLTRQCVTSIHLSVWPFVSGCL